MLIQRSQFTKIIKVSAKNHYWCMCTNMYSHRQELLHRFNTILQRCRFNLASCAK